jgi:hypothetical protein
LAPSAGLIFQGLDFLQQRCSPFVSGDDIATANSFAKSNRHIIPTLIASVYFGWAAGMNHIRPASHHKK